MAGIEHLFDINKKHGIEFIKDLFSKKLEVLEKVDGSALLVQQQDDGILNFYKRDDRQPITILDRTILSLYEKPIEYLESIVGTQQIPKNFRFGFEYFQNTNPVSIVYDKLPKNGLILTHIKEMNNDKMVKFIDDTEIVNKWADFFNVERPFVIFNGKLSNEQKTQLTDFLQTPFNDLVVEKLNTSSFTEYIITMLNPKLKSTALNNTLTKPIEGLVFRFNDGEYLSKLVDPVFTQYAREKALNRNKEKDSDEDFIAVIYSFINWFYEKNIIHRVNTNEKGEENRYLDIMTVLIQEYIKTHRVFLKSVEIKKPDYALSPEFDLNTKFIKNKEVADFIKKNKEYEQIFRILLTTFRKEKKKKTQKIDDTLKSQINRVVSDIKQVTSRLSEFYSFSEYKYFMNKNQL